MTDDVAPLPTLRIHALEVGYPIAGGTVAAVRGVSLTVGAHECLGVVGESGSGKTQLFMAVMGLLPGGAHVTGSALFQDEEILWLPPDQLNRIRGSKLAMVFQDPMTSLTPHLKIGVQLAEIWCITAVSPGVTPRARRSARSIGCTSRIRSGDSSNTRISFPAACVSA
jgi:ABC-type microcin C transport system duplicated ATPase subunit YejF